MFSLTDLSQSAIYRRLRVLRENKLVIESGSDRKGLRRRLVYVSNVRSICVSLDQDRYFVRVRLKDGTVREEGFSA